VKLVGIVIGLPIALAVISYVLLLGVMFNFDKLEEHHGVE